MTNTLPLRFNKRFIPNSYASRLAVFYVAFSVVWVILSDAFVAEVFGGPPVEWRIELIAGLIFVFITGAVLYAAFYQQEQRSADALQASEQQLRRLIESELVGICFWQTNGVITDANNTLLGMLGYSRKDLAEGAVRWDIMAPAPEIDEKIRTELKVRGRSSNYEREVVKRDGTHIWVVAGVALLDVPTNIGIGYALDISEAKQAQIKQRELEDQLRQAQKLQAVGQLAGGVAHDFNNILSIMVGYTCLLETTLEENDDRRHKTQQILKAASKASGLVRKLLAFSRRRALKPEAVDLNVVLKELEGMLARLIGDDIELSICTEGQRCVRVDSTQLEQVLINLVVNARDAMPKGGDLEIRTSNVGLDANEAASFGIEPGQYVRLTVRDSGTGMDEETKARIFEPFFSTKVDHSGTGLGLAIVYGIVKQNGGHIQVESKLNEGSTFIIYFACVDPITTETPPIQQIAERVSPLPHTEVILVAEDDPELRGMVKYILEMEGYQVLEATNGEQAVRKATEYSGTIDLFLTDMKMPRMSGTEAALQIRQERPDIRVIYLSGYVGDQFEIPAEEEVLEKPILPDVLVLRVEEALKHNSKES